MGGFKRPKTVGEWIRDHLSESGEDYPGSMYRQYKDWIGQVSKKQGPKMPSYQSFRTTVWMLKKLGLLVPTRREQGGGRSRRQYYRVSDQYGTQTWDDPGWRDPRKALYGERA